MEILPHFGPENQTRKIHKVFELYQIFMYNFLCQTVLIFLTYLFTKRIDTFWSGGISSIRGISTFSVKNISQNL